MTTKLITIRNSRLRPACHTGSVCNWLGAATSPLFVSDDVDGSMCGGWSNGWLAEVIGPPIRLHSTGSPREFSKLQCPQVLLVSPIEPNPGCVALVALRVIFLLPSCFAPRLLLASSLRISKGLIDVALWSSDSF